MISQYSNKRLVKPLSASAGGVEEEIDVGLVAGEVGDDDQAGRFLGLAGGAEDSVVVDI